MADTEAPIQSSVDENFLFGMGSRPPDVPSPVWPKKSFAKSGSVKSTKSLYFINPDTSGTMARDEELTLDIYDIYSDDPADPTETGGKIRRSEINTSEFQESFTYDTDMFAVQDARVSIESSNGMHANADISENKGNIIQNGTVVQTQNIHGNTVSGSAVSNQLSATEKVQTAITTSASQETLQVNGVTRSGSSSSAVITVGKSKKKGKAPAIPPKKNKASQGGFQIKSTRNQSAVPGADSSHSLHNDAFKQTLSSTLERRIQKSPDKSNRVTTARQESIPGFNFSPTSPIATVSPQGKSLTVSAENSTSISSDQKQSTSPVITTLKDVPLDQASGEKGNTTGVSLGGTELDIDSKGHTQAQSVVTTRTTTVTTTNMQAASGQSNEHIHSSDYTRPDHRTQIGQLANVISNKTNSVTTNTSNIKTGQVNMVTETHITRNTDISTTNSQSSSQKTKSLSQNEGPGKFQMRYKEGVDTTKKTESGGAVEQKRLSHNNENRRLDNSKSNQNSASMDMGNVTDTESVSISSTSTVRSLLKDEGFKAKISSLIGGGKKTNTTISAPSSLERKKKNKFQLKEIPLEDTSPRVPITLKLDKDVTVATGQTDIENNTFPRGNKTGKKNNDVVISTPTSPYDELNELKKTVEGGTVGRLVKDLFRNKPLTGRAIDPSTLERKRTKSVDPDKTPDSAGEQKKFKFLIEGIDIPESINTVEISQVETTSTDVTHTEVSMAVDNSNIPPEDSPEQDIDMVDMGESRANVSEIESTEKIQTDMHEDVSSMKRMEKKGFSYLLDRKLAADIKRRAGDFTSRRPHEAVEEKVKDHQREVAQRSERDSVILIEAKSKLQKKDSIRQEERHTQVEPKSPESEVLIQAKAKLNKQNSFQTKEINMETSEPSRQLVRSSMLLEAKSKLQNRSSEVMDTSVIKSTTTTAFDIKQQATSLENDTSKSQVKREENEATKRAAINTLSVTTPTQNSQIHTTSSMQSDSGTTAISHTAIKTPPVNTATQNVQIHSTTGTQSDRATSQTSTKTLNVNTTTQNPQIHTTSIMHYDSNTSASSQPATRTLNVHTTTQNHQIHTTTNEQSESNTSDTRQTTIRTLPVNTPTQNSQIHTTTSKQSLSSTSVTNQPATRTLSVNTTTQNPQIHTTTSKQSLSSSSVTNQPATRTLNVNTTTQNPQIHTTTNKQSLSSTSVTNQPATRTLNVNTTTQNHQIHTTTSKQSLSSTSVTNQPATRTLNVNTTTQNPQIHTTTSMQSDGNTSGTNQPATRTLNVNTTTQNPQIHTTTNKQSLSSTSVTNQPATRTLNVNTTTQNPQIHTTTSMQSDGNTSGTNQTSIKTTSKQSDSSSSVTNQPATRTLNVNTTTQNHQIHTTTNEQSDSNTSGTRQTTIRTLPVNTPTQNSQIHTTTSKQSLSSTSVTNQPATRTLNVNTTTQNPQIHTTTSKQSLSSTSVTNQPATRTLNVNTTTQNSQIHTTTREQSDRSTSATDSVKMLSKRYDAQTDKGRQYNAGGSTDRININASVNANNNTKSDHFKRGAVVTQDGNTTTKATREEERVGSDIRTTIERVKTANNTTENKPPPGSVVVTSANGAVVDAKPHLHTSQNITLEINRNEQPGGDRNIKTISNTTKTASIVGRKQEIVQNDATHHEPDRWTSPDQLKVIKNDTAQRQSEKRKAPNHPEIINNQTTHRQSEKSRSPDHPDSAYHSDNTVSPKFNLKDSSKDVVVSSETPRTEFSERVSVTTSQNNKTGHSSHALRHTDIKATSPQGGTDHRGTSPNIEYSNNLRQRYKTSKLETESKISKSYEKENTPPTETITEYKVESNKHIVSKKDDQNTIRASNDSRENQAIYYYHDARETKGVSQLDLIDVALSEATFDPVTLPAKHTERHKKQLSKESHSAVTREHPPYRPSAQVEALGQRDIDIHRHKESIVTRARSPSYSSQSSESSVTLNIESPLEDEYFEVSRKHKKSSEIRTEGGVKVFVVENGRGRPSQRVERQRARQVERYDSGSGVSYASNTANNRRYRGPQIIINDNFRDDLVYSPGAYSSQSEGHNTYSSLSIPIVSPTISRTSSISTNAHNTFEYSRSHRHRDYPDNTARYHMMDRGSPMTPLSINISPPPPQDMRDRTVTQAQGRRSRSEPRPQQSFEVRYQPEYAPVMKHEPSMFRMSQTNEHEMSISPHGYRDQRDTAQKGVRTTYEQPLPYGRAVLERDSRMRGREESFNSQSTGPRSPPGRFLRVDESNGGRVPVYNGRKLAVRDLNVGDYAQPITAGVHAASPAHISRVNVDRDGRGPPDVVSALDEPLVGNTSGKYSVHRIMEKRGVTTQNVDRHPDLQHQTRKRRVYQVSENTITGPSTMGSRTNNTPYGTIQAPPRVRSPEVTAVAPRLQEADKQGNQYNISLKFNAIGGSRPTSKQSHHYDERYEERMNSMNNNTLSSTYKRGGSLPHNGTYDRSPTSPNGRSSRQMTVVRLKDQPEPPQNDTDLEGKYTTKARFKVRHDGPEMIAHNESTAVRNQQYMIRSVAPSEERYVSSAAIPPSPNSAISASRAAHTSGAPPPQSEKPRFTMTVNQTMTMDYVAPEDEPDGPPPAVKRVEKPVRKQTERVRREKMNGHVPQIHDDLENYLSPTEEQDDDRHDGDIPQVVRGSILIKNAIDTTGAPKVIDVVEGDDSDDEIVVEDNVNMFHGSYFQSRENPMYSSDPDLSKWQEAEALGRRQPNFTKIFDRDEDYRSIKVNRDPPGPRKANEHMRRSAQRNVNGHDVTDAGGFSEEWEETRRVRTHEHAPRQRESRQVHKEKRSEYEISRLLTDAPAGSIKQSINVEREEEDILGPLPESHADGSPAKPEDMLNFDTVSEKVDMGLRDGIAEVAVKVRCERIVPIRGVEDMFKKSSVIVTRLIEIDLFATEERKRLWDNIVRRTNRGMIKEGSDTRSYNSRDVKLSTKDTFNLYKTFMGLAEADEAGKKRERTRIDRHVEDERRPEMYAGAQAGDLPGEDFDDGVGYDTEELDRRQEENLGRNFRSKNLETDNMSYLSAASETRDMLY